MEEQVRQMRIEQHQRHEENTRTLAKILEQAQRTNGRVTSLETFKAILESRKDSAHGLGQWAQWAVVALIGLASLLHK